MATNLTSTQVVPLQPGQNIWLMIRIALTTCIFILTSVGSCSVIYFILHSKEVRSIKNYYYGLYLLNLSASDLMVSLVCIPFTVIYMESGQWYFGSAVCKIVPAMQVMSVSASVVTLTLITFERHQAVLHPLQPRSSGRWLWVKFLVLWCWSFAVSLPSFVAYKLDPKAQSFQCTEQWDTPLHKQIYTIFLCLFNFLLPLAFIVIACHRIVARLRTPTTDAQVWNHKFIRMLMVLVLSFACCFLPINILQLVLDFCQLEWGYTIQLITAFSHILVWLNSCLNPLIYGALFLSRNEAKKRDLRRASCATNSTIYRSKSTKPEIVIERNSSVVAATIIAMWSSTRESCI